MKSFMAEAQVKDLHIQRQKHKQNLDRGVVFVMGSAIWKYEGIKIT